MSTPVEDYPNLFSPGRIGTLELPHRILQTAMGTNLANADGTISDESVAFYAARAAGGAALMTMGAVGVSYPRGRVQLGQVGISEDRFLPGLQRLTSTVHSQGGRVCAQLHHGGMSAVFDILSGSPLLCPSTPSTPAMGASAVFEAIFPEEITLSSEGDMFRPPQFKEMDSADIARLTEDFADGAVRAVETGFDAIELHAGHSYIISSFLSPAENRRTDGYGGSVRRRARLMKEIIEAIRARIGRDFPLLCKINAAEFLVEGGASIEDVRTTATIAEAAGVDAITVTATHNYGITKAMFGSYLPHEPAKLIPYAAEVKDAVSVPVVTVGRIEPEVGDRAIADGDFDFLAMGRKQLADSDFARHLTTGGNDAVRPCIYDYRCLSQSMLQQPVRCAVNPDLGYEHQNLLRPASPARQVTVVGGGPAGMEVARRLSLRGHSVALLESGDQLGGAALIAAELDPRIGLLVGWLRDRLFDEQVDVRLGTHATIGSIRAMAPGAVVLATGGSSHAPLALPGCDLPHVHAIGALPALFRDMDEGPPGDRIVVIGSDLIALQLARYMHRNGAKEIAVVDEAVQFGWGVAPIRRSVMLAEIADTDIVLHRGADAIHIDDDAVVFTDVNGDMVRQPADAVIVTSRAEPDRALLEAVRSVGIEVHLVGDSAGTGYINGAMRAAGDIAALI